MSPAPAKFTTTTGSVWLDEFFGNCTKCRVDFVALHSYGCNVNALLERIKLVPKRYGSRQVWVTEFACGNGASLEKNIDYMEAVLSKLDSLDHLHRYSWFAARNPPNNFCKATHLMTGTSDASDLSLSVLGKRYAKNWELSYPN